MNRTKRVDYQSLLLCQKYYQSQTNRYNYKDSNIIMEKTALNLN